MMPRMPPAPNRPKEAAALKLKESFNRKRSSPEIIDSISPMNH